MMEGLQYNLKHGNSATPCESAWIALEVMKKNLCESTWYIRIAERTRASRCMVTVHTVTCDSTERVMADSPA